MQLWLTEWHVENDTRSNYNKKFATPILWQTVCMTKKSWQSSEHRSSCPPISRGSARFYWVLHTICFSSVLFARKIPVFPLASLGFIKKFLCLLHRERKACMSVQLFTLPWFTFFSFVAVSIYMKFDNLFNFFVCTFVNLFDKRCALLILCVT